MSLSSTADQTDLLILFAGSLIMNRGATEDGATCCRTHKLHVFPNFITIGDVLRHKLHSIITIGVALQIIYFTVAVML